ncbi:MAG: hypothetical protein ACM3SY_06880 [Candidatus Omnitrophota bacterium]
MTKEKTKIFKILKRIGVALISMLILFGAYWIISHKWFNRTKGKIDLVSRSSQRPVIKDVRIDPSDPRSIDFIRAVVVLEIPAMIRDVTFKYRWFVNGDEITENTSVLLDKKYYKKLDSVYCRVTAIKGKMESDSVESKEVKIKNSEPVIIFTMVPSFSVPGEFRHRIRAEDPDRDTLTYRLVSPLNVGIRIDARTGYIYWFISEKPDPNPPTQEETDTGAALKLPPVITIIYEVSDTEGASQRGSIDLNLVNGTELAS